MKRKIIIFIVLVGLVWAFLHINNNWLQTTEYIIESERIPSSFDGMKIVQLSDLHDATFGDKQIKLVDKVKNLNPDFIFITGDLIDSNRYKLQNSLDLVEQLTDFAEVFYVTGNHEVAVNEVDEITGALESLGVFVLKNEAVTIEQNGEILLIAGIEDPLMKVTDETEVAVANSIDIAMEGMPKNAYTLLLSHRPEVFDIYVEKEMDVTFSGHAHGGQVRIPGLGGVIAPGQGWFPTYTSGKHEQGNTTMFVSRGLGNSIIPFRILNRPEIIAVTLKSMK